MNMTKERRLLVEVLRVHGPVKDDHGKATAALFELMVRAGYKGPNPGSLNQLVARAEAEGLVARYKGSPGSRRVYSISLSEKTMVRLATEEDPQLGTYARCGEYNVNGKRCRRTEGHEGHHLWWVRDGEQVRRWAAVDKPDEPEDVDLDLAMEEAEQELLEEEALDYERLAHELLLKASKAIKDAEEKSYHLRKQAELESTVETLNSKLASANQSIAALEQKLATAQANITELVAERDTALKLAEEEETGIGVFKSRCEELASEVERLRGVVRKYREAEMRSKNGYKLRELMDDESRSVIDQLMREVPSRRG